MNQNIAATGGASVPVCLNDNSYPVLCRQEGLSCHTCISDSASHVARVCRGLEGKAAKQLFVQIYPNSGCAPMVHRFVEAYLAAV